LITVEDINGIRDRFIQIYSTVRKEQQIDQTYIDDTFKVLEIQEPHTPMRLGTGADIVDSPAEQIITSNPQVLVVSKKTEEALRISELLNEKWIPILKRQNPNPFKEFVKNTLSRGEAYIKLAHNQSWVDSTEKRGLPVSFPILDPMVIYGSPQEDDNGIPDKVLVKFARQPYDVIIRYPDWSHPKKNEDKQFTEWIEYWDAQNRYWEADGEGVAGKVAPNVYGFTPFVRKYSGFGKRSPDGELANLIMSDIRKNRDLIKNECILGSDIASIIHLFAHIGKMIILPTGSTINKDELKELIVGAYRINVLTMPQGGEYKNEENPVPTPEMFRFMADVSSRIRQRNPFLMAGFPMGESGRQQDLSNRTALRRYDTIIENTEHAWATAFEKALEICNKMPGLYPPDLHKGDLDIEFRCVVNLKAEDTIVKESHAATGSRLLAQGEIDPITNLVEFKGYTKEKAIQTMVDKLAWEVILNSPDIRELIGLRAIEKSGMAQGIEALKQRRIELEQQQKQLATQPMQPQMQPSAMQRTMGEAETRTGREMIDMSLASRVGARKPPVPYNRGQ